MKVEYAATNGAGHNTQYVYGFSAFEKRVLIAGIPNGIKKREKLIVKIENHPKNEGQVTYSERIRELQREIECLKEIEDTFLKDIAIYNGSVKLRRDKV